MSDKDVRGWIRRADGLARSRLSHHRGRTEAEGILDTLGRATIALNDGDEERAFTLLCSVSDRLENLGVHRHQMPWSEPV